MPQITVGTAAVPIPNNGTDTLYGINVGATTLYYSQLPDVSASSGTPLSSGNAIQGWPVGQPLYIISSGGNGQFAYEANGSQIAIGAVAASLLPGSTVDVGNTVDTSGSTVKNRAQNNPTSLSFQSVLIPNSMPLPTDIGVPVTLSTAGYSSIIIAVGDNAPGIPLSSTNMIKVSITQTVNGQSIVPEVDAHYLLGACSGFVQVPVVGDTISVTGQFINTSTGGGGLLSVFMQVTGSSEVIPAPKYISSNSSGKGSIPYGGYYNLNGVGAVTQEFVNNKNGPVEVSVLAGNSSTTAFLDISVADFDSRASGPLILAGTGSIAAGSTANIPLILPMRPLYVTTHPVSPGFVFVTVAQ